MTGLTQLEQLAAQARSETGLDVRVRESNYSIGGRRQHDHYDVIVVGSSVHGPLTFDRAWSEIDGIIDGVYALRNAAGSPPAAEPPPRTGGSRPSVFARLRGWVGGAR